MAPAGSFGQPPPPRCPTASASSSASSCARCGRARSLGLKAVAKKAGLSVSYLSEIEQGKKYPRADKLVDLAHALGVPYDDLVSLRVDRGLDAVKDAIESPFLRAFPFALFGVEPEAVVNLLAGMADRGEALVRAMSDLGRAYDGRVEDVLLAALRAYQQMHANRFPELEAAAERLRTRLRLGPSPTAATLRAALEAAGTRIETAHARRRRGARRASQRPRARDRDAGPDALRQRRACWTSSSPSSTPASWASSNSARPTGR